MNLQEEIDGFIKTWWDYPDKAENLEDYPQLVKDLKQIVALSLRECRPERATPKDSWAKSSTSKSAMYNSILDEYTERAEKLLGEKL